MTILPLLGIEDLRFGASAEIVEHLWGAPRKRIQDPEIPKCVHMIYPSKIAYVVSDRGVRLLIISRQPEGVFLNGADLFTVELESFLKSRGLSYSRRSDLFDSDGILVHKLGIELWSNENGLEAVHVYDTPERTLLCD